MLTETQLVERLEARSGPLLRVEVQPIYTVATDGDDYLHYRAGEPVPPLTLDSGWTGVLHTDSETGREWRKVHVVTGRVPSHYERFMFEWYFARNERAGERIRILDLVGNIVTGLPDWYVLDDGIVILCHYDHEGHFIGANPVVGQAATPYRAMATLAWEKSVPFGDWWAARPQWHRSARTAA
jgi:hypothetical protein